MTDPDLLIVYCLTLVVCFLGFGANANGVESEKAKENPNVIIAKGCHVLMWLFFFATVWNLGKVVTLVVALVIR